jgi:hypothetical protein
MPHARSGSSPAPSHHHRSPVSPARRFTFRGCGIRSHQTSTFDPESLSPTRTQFPRLGSADRRLLFAVDQADPLKLVCLAASKLKEFLTDIGPRSSLSISPETHRALSRISQSNIRRTCRVEFPPAPGDNSDGYQIMWFKGKRVSKAAA